jgi:hypothetical protein
VVWIKNVVTAVQEFNIEENEAAEEKSAEFKFGGKEEEEEESMMESHSYQMHENFKYDF